MVHQRPKATERTLALRGLLIDLNRILRDSTEIDSDEAIGMGWELWRLATRAKTALEPIKSIVREAAQQQINGSGVVQLQGPDYTHCTVTFPESLPQLRKDVELETLRSVLGDAFGDLFSERPDVKPRKDFKKTVQAELNEADAKAVRAAVDLVEGTPRVSFS